MINKYGAAAVMAATRFSEASSAKDRWGKAAELIFHDQRESQKKSCPRGAFSGLCEEGLVKGIPPTSQASTGKNKAYALRAVELLRSGYPPHDHVGLWRAVLGGEKRAYNQQMHVVVALWEHDLISRDC